MPPKGYCELPYGPCCDPLCKFAVDIMCGCNCGHTGTDAVSQHHLFHPDCEVTSSSDARLKGDAADRPRFPAPAILMEGRSFGDPSQFPGRNRSLKWRSVPEEMRLHFGLSLLPRNAVLCPGCASLFTTWLDRGDYGKIEERASQIVVSQVHTLPYWVKVCLTAVCTANFWLRGLRERLLWPIAGFRVFRDRRAQVKLQGNATNKGGTVFVGGPSGATPREQPSPPLAGTNTLLYCIVLLPPPPPPPAPPY
eukprot:SAG25_NODE_242_length_11160_cov_254.065546_13_plen_251_part_00